MEPGTVGQPTSVVSPSCLRTITEGGQYVDRDIASRIAVSQIGNDDPLQTLSVREIEIVDGLAAGDQVVISDTEDFKNAPRVMLAD